MNPLLFFWLVLKASLFSTGGMGNLPSLHRDLVPHGWATDSQFAEALAVGQVAPGPTGLWVISFAYFVDGVRGSMLAFVAILIPPMLVLVVVHVYRRIKDHPAIEGAVHGLSLAIIGVSGIVLVGLLRGVGINAFSLAMVVMSVLLAASRRVPVPVILLIAAAIGVMVR